MAAPRAAARLVLRAGGRARPAPAPAGARLLCACPRKYEAVRGKARGATRAETEALRAAAGPLSAEQALRLLEASVVHREGALVALSKPVGLPVAGGAGAGAGGLTSRPAAGSPGQLSLEALLPQLSQRLALSPELHIVRAPGKESSGLVLLSTCHATTQRLQEFFVRARRTGRPPATYCAVTVGVPADSQGEIRTGLKLAQVGDARLVVPVAAPSQGSVARKEVKKTRTCYTVLGSAHGCSLLQLQPVTAFSSQLLVHLTLLLCPALGDHVYSPRVGAVLGQSFLLPAESTPPCTQVLPKQVLDRLRLTQQQVHLLPLHLHLHQLQLPAVVLAAPPPPFFLRTLHCLGLPTHLEPQGGCRQ